MPAATRSAMTRTFSVISSRLAMSLPEPRAIKKWAFAHFPCPTANSSIHGAPNPWRCRRPDESVQPIALLAPVGSLLVSVAALVTVGTLHPRNPVFKRRFGSLLASVDLHDHRHPALNE